MNQFAKGDFVLFHAENDYALKLRLQFKGPGELRTPHHDDSLAADGCVKGLFDQPTHIDVTIANPTGQTYLRMGAHSQRHLAIKTREKYKEDKYKNRCQQIDRKQIYATGL